MRSTSALMMRISWRVSSWCSRAIPVAHLSDHNPIWDQGYDALMVTDTLFMQNLHYRQMADAALTLDLSLFFGVVLGLRVGSPTDDQADEARTAFGVSSDAPCA